MIQKGDDLINGVNKNYQYYYNNNNNSQMPNNSGFSGGNGNLIQEMSFEDYVPLENTLPSIETVLPQYIPTPPPSLPSPSVNIMTVNKTVPQFQSQLQHQTPAPVPAPPPLHLQHDQNISKHYNDIREEQLQQLHQHHQQHNFPSYALGEEAKKITNNTSPCVSHNQSIMSQETVYNVSDGSTVDGSDADLNDEQFAYLQNLNSDNLMKFSQQSVLQQLIQEQIDIKPNLNLIPTCEEHDHGGFDFRIQVNCSDKNAQRPGVVYSKETERLYLKTNENVYIDCFYTQKMPIQPLRVRVFAVFEKDVSAPVLRCQNHISTDNDPNEVVRKSLLRCKNPGAIYHGSDTGKSINERYSVVVPLNSTVKGTDKNQLKQQLIVSFTCYNSCMNRKQTAVIFLLEGMNGEILAQRTLSVKISTCPKRDKRLYESPDVNLNKRKHLEEANCGPTEAKMFKYDNNSIKDEYSRSSFDEASDDGVTTSIFSGSVHHETETGDYVLTLKYKSRQQILETISAIYGNTIKNEELRKPCMNGKRTRESDYIKKLYYSAYNIKTRNRSSMSAE